MPQAPERTSRIEARIAPEALLVVKRAAELQGRSVSDFVVDAAVNTAQKAIEETRIIRLAVEDQRAIAEAILNPPPLTPAMERHRSSSERRDQGVALSAGFSVEPLTGAHGAPAFPAGWRSSTGILVSSSPRISSGASVIASS